MGTRCYNAKRASTDYLLGKDVKEKLLIGTDEELSKLLQEQLMQEIFDVLIQLKPEAQDIIFVQICAARDAEADAKKKPCP